MKDIKGTSIYSAHDIISATDFNTHVGMETL